MLQYAHYNIESAHGARCTCCSLPRKGNPLSMSQRNDRPLASSQPYCIVIIPHIKSFVLYFTYCLRHIESYALQLTHCTLHIVSCTLYLTHCILHIASYALHLTHYIFHIASYTLHLTHCILHCMNLLNLCLKNLSTFF